MRRSKIAFFIGAGLVIVTVSFLGSRQGLAGEENKEKLVRMGEVYNLSEDQFKALKRKVSKGSGEAAYRIFLFYELCQKDYEKARVWLRRAAKNGSPRGEYALGLELSQDTNPQKRKEAKFWLNRAANNGVELAIRHLKQPKVPLPDRFLSKKTISNMQTINYVLDQAVNDAGIISSHPPSDPNQNEWRVEMMDHLDRARKFAVDQLDDKNLRDQILSEIEKIQNSIMLAGSANSDKKEKFAQMRYGYNPSEDEFRLWEVRASEGSGEAAYQLSLYYDLSQRDHEKGLFWLRKAAENGSPRGQYDLGAKLHNDPDPAKRKKGRFWLERAAKNGYPVRNLKEPRVPLPDRVLSKQTIKTMKEINSSLEQAVKDAAAISSHSPKNPNQGEWREQMLDHLHWAKKDAVEKLDDEKLRDQVLAEIEKIQTPLIKQ